MQKPDNSKRIVLFGRLTEGGSYFSGNTYGLRIRFYSDGTYQDDFAHTTGKWIPMRVVTEPTPLALPTADKQRNEIQTRALVSKSQIQMFEHMKHVPTLARMASAYPVFANGVRDYLAERTKFEQEHTAAVKRLTNSTRRLRWVLMASATYLAFVMGRAAVELWSML